MNEYELIDECRELLNGAEEALNSEEPDAYTASMSTLFTHLCKEFPEYIPKQT